MVGVTATNRGGRESGSRKVRVASVKLVAVSVAFARAVSDAPLLGALFRKKVKVFVTVAPGEAATLSDCVALIAPVSVTSRRWFPPLSEEAITRFSGWVGFNTALLAGLRKARMGGTESRTLKSIAASLDFTPKASVAWARI